MRHFIDKLDLTGLMICQGRDLLASFLEVDIVCINQDDNEERSSQVGRMRDIYVNAEQVVMWLGPESSASRDREKNYLGQGEITVKNEAN